MTRPALLILTALAPWPITLCWWLLRCKHTHEMADHINGVAVLRCSRCLRLRPNILATTQPAYHLTAPKLVQVRPLTGIELEMRREAEMSAMVDGVLSDLERRERWARASAKVRAKMGGHHG